MLASCLTTRTPTDVCIINFCIINFSNPLIHGGLELNMTNLLYINASPRGEISAANQAAHIFTEALPDAVKVNRLDLFDATLPEVTLEITAAKMKFAMGLELDDEEARQWSAITNLVSQFVAADRYLFAIPMWNFSIPYKLKQYIDLVTHPGLTFTSDENGPKGLASGPATLIYSRGGDYSPKDGKPDPFDFQTPYMNAWTRLVGLAPVSEVLIQKSMAGPEVLKATLEAQRSQLEALAKGKG
jgi:FMN-dependent NADH-azoreductase